MSNIGPTYPAHIIVSQAEVRLVADETGSATAAKIKSDQNQVEAAQEIEAAAAKADSVNIVTWSMPATVRLWASWKTALIVCDVLANSCHYRRRALAEDQTCPSFGRGIDFLSDHQLHFGHRVRAAWDDLHYSQTDYLVGFDYEPNKGYEHTTSWRGAMPPQLQYRRRQKSSLGRIGLGTSQVL
jgi:hypothetical protein